MPTQSAAQALKISRDGLVFHFTQYAPVWVRLADGKIGRVQAILPDQT